MLKMAVLVSGGGTNLQAIIDSIESGKITNAEIAVVISNNKNAYALERAKKHGIDAKCISPKTFANRQLFNEALLAEIQSYNVDLVVLAGFLLRVPDDMLMAYPNRILNIHPSLLPKYGGKGMYGDNVHKAVVENNEKESGITIHFLNERFDEGEHIAQYKCEVLSTDTYEDVAAKVHALEYEWYPKVIEKVL